MRYMCNVGVPTYSQLTLSFELVELVHMSLHGNPATTRRAQSGDGAGLVAR